MKPSSLAEGRRGVANESPAFINAIDDEGKILKS
jgi:hypothetical protein